MSATRIVRFRSIWLVGAAILLGGCSQGGEKTSPAARTARPERRDITRECREDGVILATRTADLLPPNRERLAEMRVREGDPVKKGTVLARFDTSRFDAEIRMLEARVAAVKAKGEGLRRQREKADILRARRHVVDMTQAVDEARRFHGIQQELARLGLAPTGECGKAKAQLEAAELESTLAQALLQEITAHPQSPEMAELEAALVEAEQRLDDVRKGRSECALVAPFDGVVTLIDEAVKSANAPLADMALRLNPAGGALVSVADASSVRVIASFFENDVADLRLGQRAVVTASHVPGKEFEGQVVHMSQMGRVRGRTGTLTVEVEVKNESLQLRPGLTAQMRIVVSDRKNVLSVPVEFVDFEGDTAFVWVAGGVGKKKTVVTTGLSNGQHVEILGGLAEGDEVILESGI